MSLSSLRIPLLLCFSCLLLSTGLADDWPQFRGPGGQGISTGKDLPITWSETENMAWSVKLPGAGASSPIILGDRLYVTCYSGYGVERGAGNMDDLKLHVVCMNKVTGKQVWKKTIPPILPESSKVRDHGYAAATPATDGKHLYLFFGKTGVIKMDLKGKLIWQKSVGTKVHGWGCGTSPVLYKNLVIVNASVESGSLVALNKDDAKEAWRAYGMKESWNTPHLVTLASGKQELCVHIKDQVFGFDPGTGKELWRCKGVPDYVCPSIVSKDGIVYVIGGRRSRSMAIKAGGRGVVTDTHKVWEQMVGANVSSPVIHDGHLFWVSDRNTRAYCLRLSDGKIMYDERFPAQPYASSTLADGRIYVVSRRGGAFVMAAKPSFQILARNRLEDRSIFDASPVISDGRIYLRSTQALYCFTKKK